jgi:hypothetical protein
MQNRSLKVYGGLGFGPGNSHSGQRSRDTAANGETGRSEDPGGHPRDPPESTPCIAAFFRTVETPRGAFLAFHRLGNYRIPTKLAHLSVIGVRPAIAHSNFGRVSVDASLMGSGIDDADTGIVGVCLCWWSAEGYQCYHRCRRRAH